MENKILITSDYDLVWSKFIGDNYIKTSSKKVDLRVTSEVNSLVKQKRGGIDPLPPYFLNIPFN